MLRRKREGSQPAAGKRPQDSDFYQQRLKAWQPILTPKWVVLTFLIIGIAFVIIGFVLKNASDKVVEHKVQYDGAGTDSTYSQCSLTTGAFNVTKPCPITIDVEEDMAAPVYVYYELTNFYQNHRRYVKSRSDSQLAGTVYTDASQLADCDPLRTTDDGKIRHPCGLIAASFFNDTIALTSVAPIAGGGPLPNYVLNEKGISWESDRTKKFKPIPPAEQAKYASQVYFLPNVTVPDPDTPGNYIVNEHFIVWMRVAALPSFRKLYGKIEKDIPAGTKLTFNIGASYPVLGFDGTKSLVVSTASFMGGKNSFLGVAYIVVGFVCIGLALLFLVKQLLGGRRLGDTSFLVWQSRQR